MDNRTKTALTSGAFTPQRSQYAGAANDDTLVFKVKSGVIASLNEEGGETVVFQKIPAEARTLLGVEAMSNAYEIHLPPQIKIIGDECFAGWGNVEKINLENVEYIGYQAFLANTGEKEIHLDSVKEIGQAAFAASQGLVVHLNDKVESVEQDAFAEIAHLYYHGDLEGAPWGAEEWN